MARIFQDGGVRAKITFVQLNASNLKLWDWESNINCCMWYSFILGKNNQIEKCWVQFNFFYKFETFDTTICPLVTFKDTR